ncbi:hypothetical protein E4U46_000290, partial [Claviceps purpurea]
MELLLDLWQPRPGVLNKRIAPRQHLGKCIGSPPTITINLNPLKKQRRWRTVDGIGRRHAGGHVAGATDKEGVEEIAG